VPTPPADTRGRGPASVADWAPLAPPPEAAASVDVRGAATGGLERPAPPRATPVGAVVDVHTLAERWEEVVDQARAARPLVATALAAALPVAVSATGVVTIELQEANDAHLLALENGRDDVLGALRAVVPNAARLVVRAPDTPAPVERLTTESVRAERVASLAKRDPTLGAAISELDLDLVD
jgi:hypothetical protein